MGDEDSWTSKDDALLQFEALSEEHPVSMVRRFVGALLDDADEEELAAFVTPESRSYWSDFKSAKASLGGDGVGVGSNASRAISARVSAVDVVFVKLVPNVQEPEFRQDPRTDVLAWVTLIWRPELGGWKIHQFGDQVDPRPLPRTSPNDAPSV